MIHLQRFYPAAAFLCGFIWDAVTLGRHIRSIDFWRLGAFLLGAAALTFWLARRGTQQPVTPTAKEGLYGHLSRLRWQAPYLLLQFFFGGIFSALFILYFKSSGHFGTWLTTAFLGALLIGNEFAGKRYDQRFTLIWGLFALNATLLFNFALPHLLGSLNPLWFYVSTAAGLALTKLLWWIAPGQPGRILPAWYVTGLLLLAWTLGMIAPVPLVKKDLAVGHAFKREASGYALQIEPAPTWQFWRDQAVTVHLGEGDRLYGVSSVFAPLGVTAALEHRWEIFDNDGWRRTNTTRFQTTGGRENGFRGYSWILNPKPGDWRFVVATQDGRTIGILPMRIERGTPDPEALSIREFK